MKVTLVYVGIGVAGFNANRPLGEREGGWVPHGIASVAASAQAAGYRVDMVDLRQLGGWEDFRKIVAESPADVYGLSVSPVDAWSALKTIILIKKTAPNSKIVVGGIHPTIFPGEYDYKAVDCVVQGEGEVTFVEVLNAFRDGKPVKKFIRGTKPDLDKIPWISRELFDYQKELHCNFIPEQPRPSITMLAGRGCPFECQYCQGAENAVFGKPYRLRSAQNVVDEMVALKKRHDYRSVTFWDDTFTFNRKWVREFCDLYEQSGIKAPIAACSRADIICNNEGMVERLAEIGVICLVIGFESGSQRLLDLIKKGTTVEQNLEAARICHKYGIKVFATFMYGLPTETEAESLATAKMIDAAAPEYPSPFWFLPIKGTGLYDYCKEHDLILPGVEDRTIARTGTFNPTLKNVNYDYIEKLMKGYRG